MTIMGCSCSFLSLILGLGTVLEYSWVSGSYYSEKIFFNSISSIRIEFFYKGDIFVKSMFEIFILNFTKLLVLCSKNML